MLDGEDTEVTEWEWVMEWEWDGEVDQPSQEKPSPKLLEEAENYKPPSVQLVQQDIQEFMEPEPVGEDMVPEPVGEVMVLDGLEEDGEILGGEDNNQHNNKLKVKKKLLKNQLKKLPNKLKFNHLQLLLKILLEEVEN